MKATKLYEQLEKDFITSSIIDEWAKYMDPVSDLITEQYKARSIGLVCDNSLEIKKVYTAVFPSDKVMQDILNKKESDILLFVHHPMTWDIRRQPDVNVQMDRNALLEFKSRRISIYNLHLPLDNYGEHATTVCLAKALGAEALRPFFDYCGTQPAVFGKTTSKTVTDLSHSFSTIAGHRTSLYKYGEDEIKNSVVAFTAGGGLLVELLEAIAAEGVNVFVTGVSVKNAHSEKAHEFARSHGISILGGTHYTTEKFACQSMCKYFAKLGLPAEFIGETPMLEDL